MPLENPSAARAKGKQATHTVCIRAHGAVQGQEANKSKHTQITIDNGNGTSCYADVLRTAAECSYSSFEVPSSTNSKPEILHLGLLYKTSMSFR
jgi:hypothetical protein